MAGLAPSYPIRTDRLDLRPVTAADLDDLLDYQSRPDVARYLPYEARTRDELAAILSRPERTLTELTADDQALDLAVVERASGTVVGQIILFLRGLEHGNGEIGWVFHPDHAGRGYATEAARAVLGAAFEQMGMRRIIARLDARNDASATLCRRLGMRQEAHLVQNEWFKGEWADELVFAILRAEWPGG